MIVNSSPYCPNFRYKYNGHKISKLQKATHSMNTVSGYFVMLIFIILWAEEVSSNLLF